MLQLRKRVQGDIFYAGSFINSKGINQIESSLQKCNQKLASEECACIWNTALPFTVCNQNYHFTEQILFNTSMPLGNTEF